MKKTLKIASAALLAFSLAACSSNQDASKASKESAASSVTEEASKQDSQAASQTSEAASQDASQASSEQPAEIIVEPANSAETMSSAAAGKLEQAYTALGYAVSPIEYNTSDTGNSIADFSVDCAGSDISAFVTAAANGNTAQMIYDANMSSDETENMTVMNQWSDDKGNVVSVVRNNRANLNFVEVLDPDQQIAIHIVDALPEQLDATLQALQAIGYPVNQ